MLALLPASQVLLPRRIGGQASLAKVATTAHSHLTSPSPPPSPSLPPPRLQQKPLISDFWYDVAGWVCLVGIVFGVAALSRTNAASGPSAA